MIFKLLDKNKKNMIDKNNDLIKVICLLIHAARIDENYSEKEKKIIIDFTGLFLEKEKAQNKNIKSLSQKEIINLVEKAEEYEKNSNQILEYTQKVKKMDLNTKKLVLEFLWNIILSDDKSDIYESTLMRRICGLMYVPDKLNGEIKSSILKEKKS
tara:strand:+ start:2562 stop:3029 length:468 start_codon:yes stop_codon:yes gene_type:complete